ncbi:MAG: PAS domain-containing protein [Spirochaetes bacterium]|nr:PAS domain-containing protein [Spirochaetota bacterium]
MIFSTARKIIWVNDAFEKNLGYATSQLIKIDRWPFFAASYQEQFLSIIRKVLSGNPQESFNTPVTCLNNKIKTIRWSTLLISNNESPQQNLVIAFGVEIKSPEKNIDSNIIDEGYRIFFENMGTSIMFIREDMTIDIVNKEFEKLTGYAKARIEGKMKWTEFIADTDTLESMKKYHWRRRIDPGLAPDSYDAKIRRRDGTIRDALFCVTMIPDTTYSLASLVDITERKQMEEKLRENDQLFRNITENAIDTIYIITPDGNFSYMSPAWLDLIGEPAIQAIGKSFIPYIHPDDVQKYQELLQYILKSGERATSMEFRILHCDESVRWISSVVSAARDDKGNIVKYLGIARDITDQKTAEKKSKHS